MKKKGRPSKYSNDLADKICDMIATSDNGIHVISKKLKITGKSVFEWLTKYSYFSDNYARARELQADLLADQIIELADKNRSYKSIQSNPDGSVIEITNDNHNRTRLQIDARKWKASKLAPKKYGDKVDLTTQGEKINNITKITLTPEEIKKINDELESKY